MAPSRSVPTPYSNQDENAYLLRGGNPYRLSAVIINPNEDYKGVFERLDVEAWRSCLNINVTGTIQVTQKLLPLVRTLFIGIKCSVGQCPRRCR